MMVFESSTTPVARQLKLLVYGGAGSGKTWFAIHAPSPLIIDTESSTDPYRGQPNLPAFTVAKNARPSEITAVLEQFASLGYVPNGRERLQPETLVIDSFTLLWMVAQEAGQKLAEARAVKYKRPPEEARLAFGDWSLIKRPIQRLYTQLLNLPVHVIVTARQMEPPTPPQNGGQNGRQKGLRAEWTRSPANRQRTLDWLAENGLSESDANAALGIDDWRKTTLTAEEFKAAIEEYIAHQLAGEEAPDEPATATPDEAPAPKLTPRPSSKAAPESAPKKCANCGVDDARPDSEFCQTCADLLFKPKPKEHAEDAAEAAQTE